MCGLKKSEQLDGPLVWPLHFQAVSSTPVCPGHSASHTDMSISPSCPELEEAGGASQSMSKSLFVPLSVLWGELVPLSLASLPLHCSSGVVHSSFVRAASSSHHRAPPCQYCSSNPFFFLWGSKAHGFRLAWHLSILDTFCADLASHTVCRAHTRTNTSN